MSIELNKIIRYNVYKNGIFQSITIGVGFYIYPLLVGYLNETVLGVWFTLMSVASWFMILDIGIAQGLRNKLTELIVKNKIKSSKAYLSSTYYYFALFLLFIISGLGVLIIFVDLHFVFNVKENSVPYLNLSVFLVLITICINLFFSINYSLSNALQNASFTNYRNMLYSVTMITLLIIMTYLGGGNILSISIIFIVSNVIVNIFTTIFLYKNNLQFLPSYKLASFRLFKDNLTVGVEFFIINISSIIMFSTDTMLVTHLLGAENVVYYALTLKFFMGFLMIQWLYVGPLWSAYTDKYHRGDFAWIVATCKKSILLACLLCVGIICSNIVFDDILNLWIGDKTYYNRALVVSVSALVAIRIWNSNFSTLLNGLGLTKLQMKTAIIATALNIPLSIYLVKYLDIGISGIAYGSTLSLSIFAFIAPFYSYKILKNRVIA